MRSFALFLVGMLALPSIAGELQLEVDLSESRLTASVDGQTSREYNVGVGSKKYPTPQAASKSGRSSGIQGGCHRMRNGRERRRRSRPGHPDNPMKRVKIFFKEPDYYIHGSDDPSPSHGCIRMTPTEASELARLLMDHGGQPRSLPWYRRIFKRRTTRVVLLSTPITIEIHE